MKLLSYLISRSIFGVALAFSAALLFSAERAQATDIPATDMPANVGIQLKNDDMTTAALDLCDNTGVGYVRKAVYWSSVEPTPGTFDWSQQDAWVSQMESRGWSMVITVVWNNRAYEDIYDRAIVTEAGRTAFANFVRTLAARYAGKNIIWEIWNEPNLGTFWHGDSTTSNTDAIADEYTALVKAAAPAFKQGDPNCRVVAGSVSCLYSSSFNWLQRCISQGLLTSGIDGLSVHPYGFPYPEQALVGGYGDLRNLLIKAGAGDMPVISSEVGFATNSLVGLGIPSSEALNYQAYMFVRQNLIDRMADIRVSIWYQWKDVPATTGGTAVWGVVNQDLSLRPTYNAASTMTAQLAGYHFVERINNNSATEFLTVFENSAGQQKLVAWTKPRTSYQISLPINTTSTSVSACDVFGNLSTIPVVNGWITLTVSGAPQYITLPGPMVEPPVLPTFNLAQNGAIYVSSGGDTAHYLNDGVTDNTNSRWFSSGTETYPQWVEVELGKNYDISKVRWVQYAQRTTNYSVEVWNGTAWLAVASGTGNTAMNIEPTFTPTTGSRVRFNVLSGPGYQKVYEFEVYGASSAADTQAPTVPQNVTGTAVSSTQVNLSWSPSTDNVAVVGYDINCNGTYLGSVTGTSFSDTGLIPGAEYTYTVQAFDAANNVSTASSAVVVQLPENPTINLALTGTAYVSSGTASARYLIDGVTDTTNSRWLSDGTQTYPQWAEVDLGKTCEISKIRWLQYTQRTTDYSVEVWNGSAWQTVASGTNNTDLNIEQTFTPATGSRVRFNILAGTLYQKVYEFEIYGTASQ